VKFNLIDKVETITDERIVAVKYVSLAEEYLADHFPTFPVMTGVLMLQTLVEAGAWLLRLSDDFAHSIIVLREARNVKYGTFMEPGRQMQVRVELAEQDAGTATFKGKGETDGLSTVSAKFTVARYNLRDRDPALAAADERLVQHYRGLYSLIRAKSA